MIEVWKNLVFGDIETMYKISNTGYIKDMANNEIFVEIYHSVNGYDYVALVIKHAKIFKNGKIQKRHFPLDDLVACTFCKCPDELIGKPVKVEHIDGNLRNNHYENLRWVEDIEEWRDVNIPIYENTYQISNWGNVRNINGNLLKTRLGDRQYLIVSFKKCGKQRCLNVHRIVALTFYPNESANNKVVNHIDENKLNNNAKNLELITHQENMSFGMCSSFCADALCLKIKCIETGVIYDSLRNASEQTGINYGNLSSCCSGRLHTAGGYRWVLVE